MKRSRMVAILEENINSNLYQDYQLDSETVSSILAALESAGMLPPSNHTSLTNMSGAKVGESFTACWEPENDEG